MRGLGIPDGEAAAYDVNATCLSFVTAFEIATRQLTAGAARAVLIVSSEVASRALPWDEAPDIAALFGDGAAAAVLTPSTAAHITAMRLRTYPSAYEACGIGAGGTRFDFTREAQEFAAHSRFMMDGKALFRLAAQHFGTFVEDLLAEAGWHASDVDLVIPHQASPLALAHMIRQTGFPEDRVVNIVKAHGNQIAASIPFTLDLAREAGRIPPGTRVLMLGTSAGVSFGGIALVA
jgi:3-oxoacyl-[acyl-carrier-protein] synthase-3